MAGKSRRGFASMDPEKRRQIASKGARAAHNSGKAHRFNSEEAAEAGKIGGRSVSRDREHMAAIGRMGGKARGSDQLFVPTPDPGPEPAAESPRDNCGDAGEAAEDPRRTSDRPPRTPDVPAGSEGPRRVLLENGPFAGCTVRLELANWIPDRLTLDRKGLVIASTPASVEGLSGWVGLVADPIPVIDPGGVLQGHSRFEYERSEDEAVGFDGILRFAPAS